jgi:Uma2 family endonuclease
MAGFISILVPVLDVIMAPPHQNRSPQEELQCHYASRQIEQTDYLFPEFRFELVDGQFVVGGTMEGSRWLLREALMGWGLESAITLVAPLSDWWEALRIAYRVNHHSPNEWLIWAEELPMSDEREGWYPPLGSQFKGEHRWVGDRLRWSLSHAVTQAGIGKCFGPHYGMWIGNQVFTPDILLLEDMRLAENLCYDCYMRGAASLVIEIVLPEQAEVDEQIRRQHYEQHRGLHYWTVNPIAQQVQFWEWTPEGYQARSPDSDGCYRGFPGLTFSPDLLWVNQEGLPIITSVHHARKWQLSYEEGSSESWDSIWFAPNATLEPCPIQPEQFIAWCPESKVEGAPFPLIGGERGTRNAIAMLVMSLGLVETVKLISGYEWVRVLRRIERQQQQDEEKRQHWWTVARTVAQQLQDQHQVGGVGVIGDLLQSEPLGYWSELHFVLWDVPEQFSGANLRQIEDVRVHITEVGWATPAVWQRMNQDMTVLLGEWQRQEFPRLQQRLRFKWLDK